VPATTADEPTVHPDARVASVHPGDVAEMAAQLRLSTTRLWRRLRREAEADLSPTLGSALAAIQVHGPITLGDLADHERVSPPTVTKVVNQLEQQGLIERLVDPADRRVCRVECSAAGAELIEGSRQRKNAWLAARIDSLTEDDRARLAAALQVLEELASGDRPGARP
jgi:DNA-binding MarR family transcriptional regulator